MTNRLPILAARLLCALLVVSCGSAPKKPEFDPVDPSNPSQVGDGRRTVDQIDEARSPGPAAPARLTLRSGVRLGVANSENEWADIRWTFPHHEPTPRLLGVARLTARLLVDSPLRDSTAPSLRRQIDSLGGRIETKVTSRATEIDLRVPADRWRNALVILMQALESVPTANIRAERYAVEESRALTRTWLDDPLAGLIDRVRTFEQKPVTDWVDEAESTSLLQAQAFHGREYSARGSVIAARLPGGLNGLKQLSEAVQDWAIRNPGTPRPGAAARLIPQGLFWAPARAPGGASAEFSATTPEGYAEVAWVFEMPPLGSGGAEASRIAIELLTLDGVGGRLQSILGEELNARIPLRPEVLHENDRSVIVLRGTVPTEAVLPLRDAVGLAFESLLEDKAYPQEWAAAAERARLRFQAEITTRDGWLRAATATLRHGVRDSFELVDGELRPVADQPLDPWVYGQAVILRSTAEQFAPFLELVLEKVPLMFALGGEPVRTENVFPLQNALLSDRRLEVTVADDTERIRRAADQWRETMTALGGQVRLAGVAGYRSVCTTRSGRGPELNEQVFARVDGLFRRVRRILDTTIITVGKKNVGYDRIEGNRTELSFDDLRGQRQELLRHPVVLAGRVARGEDRYRLVSVRQVRDRELLILERLDDNAQALRVWIDSESGLIRTVRSLETRADGQVWVREDYFDYRDTGNGIRAPFQRHSSLDGSLRGLTTEWLEIEFGQIPDGQVNDGR